jgi:hypothetical protein
MKVLVKNCRECPLAQTHEIYGNNLCRHPNEQLGLNPFTEELPKDTVHENCPLKQEPLTISL